MKSVEPLLLYFYFNQLISFVKTTDNQSPATPTSPIQNKSTWYHVRTNLSFYVLIAIIAGVLLGYFYPSTAVKMEVIGKNL